MIRLWKVPHILKGMLTWVPVLNTWRLHHATTGGTDSLRYCYSVWLRHLVTLYRFGFKIHGAQVGELGPGDSIGVGLAALLSGANAYVGLDVVAYSAKSGLEKIFDELVEMYSHREPIPDQNEFSRVRPTLDSYAFPDHAVDFRGFAEKVARIRSELQSGVNSGESVRYRAPWIGASCIPSGSLDLVFSQSVLQYADDLEETYGAMAQWLKPGGHASHTIDLSGHYLSPYWNGHRAYSDYEWSLARGRREFFLNREPLSTHLACAKKAGFEMLLVKKEYNTPGLGRDDLARRFRTLDDEDLRTRGVMLVLRKI